MISSTSSSTEWGPCRKASCLHNWGTNTFTIQYSKNINKLIQIILALMAAARMSFFTEEGQQFAKTDTSIFGNFIWNLLVISIVKILDMARTDHCLAGSEDPNPLSNQLAIYSSSTISGSLDRNLSDSFAVFHHPCRLSWMRQMHLIYLGQLD